MKYGYALALLWCGSVSAQSFVGAIPPDVCFIPPVVSADKDSIVPEKQVLTNALGALQSELVGKTGIGFQDKYGEDCPIVAVFQVTIAVFKNRSQAWSYVFEAFMNSKTTISAPYNLKLIVKYPIIYQDSGVRGDHEGADFVSEISKLYSYSFSRFLSRWNSDHK